MKVMIATPVYGDMFTSGCHTSILDTIMFFQREFPHIEFVPTIRNASFFPHARNALASLCVNDESFTHVLFVDSDMGFTPELVAKMLAFGKPVVGAIYPEKQRDFDAFRRALKTTSSSMQAQLSSIGYVFDGDAIVTKRERDGKRVIEVIDGFVRVTRAGTGLLLVERAALVAMREKLPHLWMAEPAEWVRKTGLENGGLLQCFAVEPGDDGVEVGSDVAFSRRWVEGCGGEIWSCVDEAIIRAGTENYVGQYLMHLQATAPADLSVLIQNSSEA